MKDLKIKIGDLSKTYGYLPTGFVRRMLPKNGFNLPGDAK